MPGSQDIFHWLVADNLFWLLLDRVLMLVAVVAAVVALAFWRKLIGKFRRLLIGNRFAGVGGELDGIRFDALIFTVSKVDLPIMAIDALKPKMVGLLHSNDTYDEAKAISEKCRKLGINTFTKATENADDVAMAHRYALELLDDAKKNGASSIAVDITGGKKPMSIGAFMAAEEGGVRSLYTTCDYDSKGGARVPRTGTEKIVVVSKPQSSA